MRVIREKVEEDLVITEDTLFMSIGVGGVRVRRNATLEMQGIILGKLILEPGSRVVLDGIAHGDVLNEGGRLEVFGIVHGTIRSNPGDCRLFPVERRLGGRNDQPPVEGGWPDLAKRTATRVIRRLHAAKRPC